MRHTHHKDAAFSLVELSIVLVILGLLTGGILGGQSLIRAAQLRSVINEYQQYNTAVNAFRLTYQDLPGDQRDAFRFWGSRAGCTDTAAGWFTDGCNGNGDGHINEKQESLRAWQFLSLSGLAAGSFDGRATSDADVATDKTMPLAKLGRGAWHLSNLITPHGGQYLPPGKNLPSLRISTPDSGAPDSPIMSPDEAYSLDTKMDDGKPGQGFVTSYNLSSDPSPCVNDGSNTAPINNSSNPGFSPYSTTYYLSSTSLNCRLQFALQ